MIQVLVERKTKFIQSITITGHADSGPKGQDLVCAAVSSIATGALNALDQLTQNQANLVYQETPEAKIQIHVLNDSSELQSLLEMLMIQLKTLAHTQKKYIQIQEV